MSTNKNVSDFPTYTFFDERKVTNIAEIESNLAYRNLPIKDYNLDVLQKLFPILKKHSKYKASLAKMKNALRNEEAEAKNRTQNDERDLKLRNKDHFLQHQVNAMSTYFENLRKLVLSLYFSLPNRLHEHTAKDDKYSVVYTSFSNIPNIAVDHHLKVGKELKVLHYQNPVSYYLMDEAANLELAVTRFFSDILQKEYNFISTSNPDMYTNMIANSISYKTTAEEYLKIDKKELYLSGGASLSAFCAFRTGRSAHTKFLPERHFTCARHYSPQPYIPMDGLYSVIQKSLVKVFVSTDSAKQMNDEFTSTLEMLKALYQRLAIPFRICYQPASVLTLNESLRASIQVYSPHRREFVQIAYLSIYDDFISQRLKILCHDKNKNFSFVKIIEGTAINFPIFLAYLLEHSTGKSDLLIPDCLLPYMYTSK